jgi:hypothetical protein
MKNLALFAVMTLITLWGSVGHSEGLTPDEARDLARVYGPAYGQPGVPPCYNFGQGGCDFHMFLRLVLTDENHPADDTSTNNTYCYTNVDEVDSNFDPKKETLAVYLSKGIHTYPMSCSPYIFLTKNGQVHASAVRPGGEFIIGNRQNNMNEPINRNYYFPEKPLTPNEIGKFSVDCKGQNDQDMTCIFTGEEN